LYVVALILSIPLLDISLHHIGLLFDFKADGSHGMTSVFNSFALRGGAHGTIAPEIAFAPQTKVELDYSKADIWSLGVVLATMMGHDVDNSSKQLMMDDSLKMAAAAAAAAAAAVMVATIPTTSESASSISSTIVPAAVASPLSSMSLCHQLLVNMVTLSPDIRWSCEQVLRHITQHH
jgi:serine/threonine protein kinase